MTQEPQNTADTTSDNWREQVLTILIEHEQAEKKARTEDLAKYKADCELES